ncbi:putative glycolipid-binding domain-containing protein [Micromonospora sp. NPDC005806]|uniref:putative glycolipid-binding domain-containing protein n=1 Tax=Micromonospora sp. NPDC005806 TaxID=3364234 RepID=UPI00369FAC22
MPTVPKSLFWSRTDTAGSEHVVLDDRQGLSARGVLLAVDPIPYTCRYQLTVGADWAVSRLEAEAEGAGWARSVRLERTGDGWRVRTGEEGDLDAALVATGHPPAGLPGTDEPDRLAEALDVDLSGSPLFNTLPIRRIGLGRAPADQARQVTVAWVLLPGLAVLPADQVYTSLGPGRIRFNSDSFAADLDIDPNGFVVRYPGLAERIDPR